MTLVLSSYNPTVLGILKTLTRIAQTTPDINDVLRETIHTTMLQLPLSGATVWVLNGDQRILTPAASRLPAKCSTNAIADDDPLVIWLRQQHYLLLEEADAHPLMHLADNLSLAVAPIRCADRLVGLIAYVAERNVLVALTDFLEISAAVLAGALLEAILQRQQSDSEDVGAILFRFAVELRKQQRIEAILQNLNSMALQVFRCDWAGVYIREEQSFRAVQLHTRTGKRAADPSDTLHAAESILIKTILKQPRLHTLADLRDEPDSLPGYVARHSLRGVVLVPLQRIPDQSQPHGLLVLGYRAPLVPLNRRSVHLARGLARIVGIALEQTLIRGGIANEGYDALAPASALDPNDDDEQDQLVGQVGTGAA